MKYSKILLSFLVLSIFIILSGCSLVESVSLKMVQNNMNKQLNYQVVITNDINISNVTNNIVMDIQIDLLNEDEGYVSYMSDYTYQGITTNRQGYIELNKEVVTSYAFDAIWTYMEIKPEQYFKFDEYLSLNMSYLFTTMDFKNDKKFIDEVIVDGIKCKMFEVSINNSELITNLIIDKTLLERLEISSSDFTNYLDNAKLQVYVNSNDNLIRKIEVNVKPLFNELLDNKNSSNQFDVFNITIEFKNFNGTDVVIPRDLKDKSIQIEYNPDKPSDSISSPTVNLS